MDKARERSNKQALKEVADYIDRTLPILSTKIVEFWREKQNDLPPAEFSGVSEGGWIVSVNLRTRIASDVEEFVLGVIVPAWVEAYASDGGLYPEAYVRGRAAPMIESMYSDQLYGLQEAASILFGIHGEDTDPKMMIPLYGLTSKEMASVAKYEASLISKNLARAAYEYARRLLLDRSRRIAGYEPADARAAGHLEREMRERPGISAPNTKIWHTDPSSNVCERCQKMDGEERSIAEPFSGGVQHEPLHPACACYVEYP